MALNTSPYYYNYPNYKLDYGNILGQGGGGNSIPGQPTTKKNKNNIPAADWLSGIDMDRLKDEAPFLYTKAMNYMQGKGKFGKQFQYLFGNLLRATQLEPFSQNDIRNAALVQRQNVGAQYNLEKERMEDEIAKAGLVDSGETYGTMQTRDAEAAAQGEASALEKIQQLEQFRESYKKENLMNAINAMNSWVDIIRRNRLNAYTAPPSQGNGWTDLSGILGAASNILTGL